MMRKAPNCTPKRTNPAAREIAKVWIVVPTLRWAEPAAPLMIPVMSDIFDYVTCGHVALRPMEITSRNDSKCGAI